MIQLVQAPPPPTFAGDPETEGRLGEALPGALRGTDAYGPLPARPWRIHMHTEAEAFEREAAAGPWRSAAWVGDVLHLRPWIQLQGRDVGAVLRHELVHRRLAGRGLARWEEEARCLWAENHTRPPAAWPAPPPAARRAELDRALAAGTPAAQRWAYGALRAWLAGRPMPARPKSAPADVWQKDAFEAEESVQVVWPPERLPSRLAVNGRLLPRHLHARYRFHGEVRFGAGSPIARLRGSVVVRRLRQGWELTWRVPASRWVAAAVEGELGAAAPGEAKRALASVLGAWREGPGRSRHPGGALCALTHCAVVRGEPARQTLREVATAPPFPVDPRWACFTGSAGGASLSPREVWGAGPAEAAARDPVPGDRWARWERTLSAPQVAFLKRTVASGAAPGQRSLKLGESGPYAVEVLRIAAGRAFGWTAWPSNACEAQPSPDGGLLLRGRGWGHNAGLCLATALDRARQGDRAEAILADAFPASWGHP